MPDISSVSFQTRFGEYGGAYVTHCHNTVHEDFALLMRYQLLKNANGDPDNDIFAEATLTPNPTADGIVFLNPEILPEGDPRNAQFASLNQ